MNGVMVSSFKEKTEAGESFLKILFKESEGCNIQEILKVISLFPRFIKKEMNNFLKEEGHRRGARENCVLLPET